MTLSNWLNLRRSITSYSFLGQNQSVNRLLQKLTTEVTSSFALFLSIIYSDNSLSILYEFQLSMKRLSIESQNPFEDWFEMGQSKIWNLSTSHLSKTGLFFGFHLNQNLRSIKKIPIVVSLFRIQHVFLDSISVRVISIVMKNRQAQVDDTVTFSLINDQNYHLEIIVCDIFTKLLQLCWKLYQMFRNIQYQNTFNDVEIELGFHPPKKVRLMYRQNLKLFQNISKSHNFIRIQW